MSLHDELVGEYPATGCILCRFLASLPESTRGEWSQELARPVSEVGNMAVVRALMRRNVLISEASVRRHRERHG